MSVDPTPQGLRQKTVRDVTGTALSYEGDWHALFDLQTVADGDFNGRLLKWINTQLSASYTDVNGAMAAFAAAKAADTDVTNWGAMGAFTIA